LLMRVCIVGCGAVGSLFAANLARLDDVEVWAFDLAQEHVDAINRDGLRLSGAGDEIERLADACTRGGMPASAVADARGPQWRKVIFNASTNPIGALTGLTHGRVCEDPALRALVTALVDEGKAVATAQGIELDADPEELIDHAARP